MADPASLLIELKKLVGVRNNFVRSGLGTSSHDTSSNQTG
jgi:hypothetical protein